MAENFGRRIREFGNQTHKTIDGETFLIKLRTIGCFHREHSPVAYRLIDDYFSVLPESDCYFKFEEHESGPEILVYLAVTTSGITLAKSIIDLIMAILKARSEGIKKGDKRSSLELVVRKIQTKDETVEEKIIRVDDLSDFLDKQELQKQIEKSVKELKRN